jgi:hypothetical protein
MVNEAETGQRRWLLKAVREATGELYQQFRNLDDSSLRWRPEPGEWCLKEIAGHMRDAEQLYQSQIELIIHNHEPLLPYEPIEVLVQERDYTGDDLSQMLYEYESAREETVWNLRMISDHDWERTGLHPYRGSVSIMDLAQEMHEHDLEHLIQARRLREALVKR